MGQAPVDPVRRLHSVTGTLLALVLLGAVATWGQNAGLAATIGSIGLGASLAFQDTVRNILAGITLRTEKKIRVGSEVTVPGPDGAFTGVVQSMELRTSDILSADGELYPCPNSQLTASVIIRQAKENA